MLNNATSIRRLNSGFPAMDRAGIKGSNRSARKSHGGSSVAVAVNYSPYADLVPNRFPRFRGSQIVGRRMMRRPEHAHQQISCGPSRKVKYHAAFTSWVRKKLRMTQSDAQPRSTLLDSDHDRKTRRASHCQFESQIRDVSRKYCRQIGCPPPPPFRAQHIKAEARTSLQLVL